MKYNFTSNFTGNYPVDTIIYVNNAVSGLFIYAFVLAFFIVLTYAFVKATDDVTLSVLRGFWATTMLSILIYYLGVYMGVSLFSGSFLILMILVSVIGIAVLYYQRNQVSGGG